MNKGQSNDHDFIPPTTNLVEIPAVATCIPLNLGPPLAHSDIEALNLGRYPGRCQATYHLWSILYQAVKSRLDAR